MQQSVIYDTDEDTAADVITAIARSYGYETAEEALADIEVEEEEVVFAPSGHPRGWTLAKMRRYVTQLRPTACLVLRAIAEGAPSIPVATVQQASGLPGAEFAGAMSSFGFAARNTRGVRQRPFDKYRDEYQIDEEVAQIALQALGEIGR